MENNELNPMKSPVLTRDFSLMFADSLWSTPRDNSRTPLFIERFKGVRHNPQFSIHNFWEFTAVASHGGTIEFNNKTIKIGQHDIILIPPGVQHREYADKPLDTIWLGFKYTPLALPLDNPTIINSGELFKAFSDFWYFASRRRTGIGMELDGQLMSILGYFIRSTTENNGNNNVPMEKVIIYINDHFSDAISMAMLARMLNVSESYFYRQFKNYTGQTPVEYLTALRIKNVIINIRKTNLPIFQIAKICGFADPYYLSKTFKKITGMSPLHYRESTRNITFEQQNGKDQAD